jgi:hypothetical protein
MEKFKTIKEAEEYLSEKGLCLPSKQNRSVHVSWDIEKNKNHAISVPSLNYCSLSEVARICNEMSYELPKLGYSELGIEVMDDRMEISGCREETDEEFLGRVNVLIDIYNQKPPTCFKKKEEK